MPLFPARRLPAPCFVLIAAAASGCQAPNPAYYPAPPELPRSDGPSLAGRDVAGTGGAVGSGGALASGGASGAGGASTDAAASRDAVVVDTSSPPPPVEPATVDGGGGMLDVVADRPPDAAAPSLPTPVVRWSLDPGSAAGVTLRGGATWSSERSPAGGSGNVGSVSLLGGDDYAELSVSGLPGFSAPKTVSFWYWMEPPLTARRYILVFASSNDAALEFLVDEGELIVWIGATSGGMDVILDEPRHAVKAGWNHVAYTYASGNSRIFLDGAFAKSSPLTHRTNSVSELLIGTVNPGPSSATNFVGKLDDLRIYNSVLSDSQIKALFDGAP